MPESLSNLVDTLAEVFSSYNFLMVLYVFYIRLHVLVDIIRIFFQFQIFQQKPSKPTKSSEKGHSFYNIISLKKPPSFYEPHLNPSGIENNMLPQNSQKPSFILQIFQQICFCLVSEKTFSEMVQYHILTPKSHIPEAL